MKKRPGPASSEYGTLRARAPRRMAWPRRAFVLGLWPLIQLAGCGGSDSAQVELAQPAAQPAAEAGSPSPAPKGASGLESGVPTISESGPAHPPSLNTPVPASLPTPDHVPPPAPAPAPASDPARSAALAAYKAFMASYEVPSAWTGEKRRCIAGDTSAASKEAVLRSVNYYRALTGLPPVALNAGYSAQAQQAALMFSAQHALSHTPGPDWACYTPVGAVAARSSNIALGFGGPSAVHAYMQDLKHPGIGHRRWLLFSRLLEIGTGDTPDSNALWVVGDRWNETLPAALETLGIAWPPRGYVPWSDKVVRPSDIWSFSVPDADLSTASVVVRNDRGEAMRTTVTRIAADGGDGTITWTLDSPASAWSRAPVDTRFQVTVEGVKVQGGTRSFVYETIFVQP